MSTTGQKTFFRLKEHEAIKLKSEIRFVLCAILSIMAAIILFEFMQALITNNISDFIYYYFKSPFEISSFGQKIYNICAAILAIYIIPAYAFISWLTQPKHFNNQKSC